MSRSVLFVLIVVFIDMVGIGIAMPVIPVLVGEYVGDRSLQTHWYMAMTVAYGAMQFLCAPGLGALSDRFGRRPVLLAAIIGLGFHYLLIGFAASLWVMLLARLLGGITGASFSVANAYLADVSAPEERAKAFGMIGAAFGLGFICGPPLGGLLGEINLHLPFFIAAALSFANAIYGYFVVTESLPPERRSKFALSKANPFRALIALVSSHAIGNLVIIYSLYMLAHATMIQTWVLAMHFRFDWTTAQNGIVLGCVGLLSAVVQGGLVGRLVKWLGEERLAMYAVGTNMVAQFLYGIAWQGWMIYVILFASFIVFTAAAALQGLVSKGSDPRTQGVTLGALTSISSLCFVVGALAGNGILGIVSEFPQGDFRLGATFYFTSALNCLAFTMLVLRRKDARAAAS